MRSCANIIIVLAASVALLATPAAAVKPGRWEFLDRASYARSRLHGVEVTYEGRLKPGLVTTGVPVPVDYIWSLVELEDGVYLGTGDEARIWRVEGAAGRETAVMLWKGDGLEVYALTATPRGELVAGVSPNGRILRFARGLDGLTLVEEFSIPDSYVWRIVARGEDLWIASGSGASDRGGALYRYRAGRLEEIHRVEDPHILSLAVSGDWLYAGTQGNAGVVLCVKEIDAARPEVSIAFDPEQNEVVDLVAAPDGGLFVAAQGAASRSARPPAPPDGNGEEEEEEEESEAPPTPMIRPSAPSAGTAIYRLDAAGKSDLWIMTRFAVRALAWSDDGLLASTADQGDIFRIDGPALSTLVLSLDEKSVLALTSRYAAAARPSVLHRIARASGESWLRSEALDAGGPAIWGVLDVEASGPSWTIRTRSGNVARPDDSWSAWSLPLTAPGGRIESPTSRYLQFEIRHEGADARDYLRAPSISWQAVNRAPRVTEVTAARLELDPRTSARLNRAGPLGPLVAQIVQTAKNLENEPPRGRGGITAEDLLRPFFGLVNLAWKAEDPDKDRITARIEILEEGAAQTVLLEEDFAGNQYIVNAKNFPDGRYRARITVSDALDNTAATALTDSRLSEVFVIDNTPPEISLAAAAHPAGGVMISGKARDASNRITSIYYLDDAGAWTRLTPDDGICDQVEESFRFTRPAGLTHRLAVVKALDSHGNVGYARLRY